MYLYVSPFSDSLIVILLKQDDRYVLKIHNIFPGKSDRMMAKPIIKLNNLHHRPVATGKYSTLNMFL